MPNYLYGGPWTSERTLEPDCDCELDIWPPSLVMTRPSLIDDWEVIFHARLGSPRWDPCPDNGLETDHEVTQNAAAEAAHIPPAEVSDDEAAALLDKEMGDYAVSIQSQQALLDSLRDGVRVLECLRAAVAIKDDPRAQTTALRHLNEGWHGSADDLVTTARAVALDGP